MSSLCNLKKRFMTTEHPALMQWEVAVRLIFGVLTSTYNLYISDFWYIYDLGSGQAPDLSIMSQWGKYWNPSQRISKV